MLKSNWRILFKLWCNDHVYNDHVYNDHVYNDHVYNNHVYNDHVYYEFSVITNSQK